MFEDEHLHLAMPGKNHNSLRLPLGTLVLAALLTAACYWTGLKGPYVFDDYGNLLSNPSIRDATLSYESLVAASLSSDSSPLRRPLSMLSFALNFATTGDDVWYLKTTNLAIHLATGALLAWLGFILLQHRFADQSRTNAWLAVCTASVWLLHPLNLTAVLYVIQRMTSLSALLSVLALITYAKARSALDAGHKATASTWGLLLVLLIAGSIGAKETGALTVVYILALEFAWLRPLASSRMETLRRWLMPVGIACIAGALLFLLFAHYGGPDRAYAIRDFSLKERVLTEARALWWYLGQIFWPNLQELGLVHDDWEISRNLLSPPSSAFAVMAWTVAITIAVLCRKKTPALSLALFWFLGGHILESTVIPLELIFEHRNYLPMWGVCFGAVIAASKGMDKVEASTSARASVAIATLMALGFVMHIRAMEWSTLLGWSQAQIAHHPNSPSGHFFLASVHATLTESTDDFSAQMHYLEARQHFIAAQELRPESISALVALALLDSRMGMTPSPAIFDDVANNVRTGHISTSDFNALVDVFECMTARACDFPRSAVRSIADAAMQSSQLHPNWKRSLENSIASYWLHVENDLSEAETLARKSTYGTSFNIKGALVLVQVLAAKKDWEQARKLLDEIEARDSLGRYTPIVATMRTQLDELVDSEARSGSERVGHSENIDRQTAGQSSR